MKKIILIVILFTAIKVQAQQVIYEHPYPQDTGTFGVGTDIIELNDGGFIGVGFDGIEYIDTSGQWWLPYYHSIFRTDANGDIIFIRNLDYGDTAYFNQYGHGPANVFFNLVQISDSIFIAVGYTQTVLPLQSADDADLLLYKFDINGDSLGTYTLSVPDTQLQSATMIMTSTGELLVSGLQHDFTFNNNIYNSFLAKFDTSGNLIWKKTYNSPFDFHIGKIVESPQGGYIISGGDYQGTWFIDSYYNPVVMKTDTAGNVIWLKHFTNYTFTFSEPTRVSRTADGFYILSCPDDGNPTKHFKLNENGDTLWFASAASSYLTSGLSISSTDDTYDGIVAAFSVKDSLVSSATNGVIYRLAGDGNVLWQRRYGFANTLNTVYNIKQTSDNGFVVVGSSNCCNHMYPPFSYWISSIYVIKFDSLGLLYPPPTGFNELQQVKLSEPYPNPSSARISFSALVPSAHSSSFGETGAYLYLFDMHGAQLQKLSLQTGINNLTLDVSSLRSGEYLAVISIDGYNAGGKKFSVVH